MREHFAAFRRLDGTPGTPEEHPRCSNVEYPQPPVPQGFQAGGTLGTPGTPRNDNIRCANRSDDQTQPLEAQVAAADLDERAAILEHDGGLALPEADRIARGLPDSSPGVTVRAPSVELSGPEYDAHLDALIAAAIEDAEISRLTYAKRKGWVVPRGDGTVFTRGRA